MCVRQRSKHMPEQLKARFLNNREGNVGILFAFLAVPMAAMSGLAIDYSRAVQVERRMQAAADAAVLGGAGAINLTKEQRVTLAKELFAANLQRNTITQTVMPTVTFAGSKLSVSGTAHVPASFAAIAGWDHIKITASATALAAQRNGPGGKVCVLALNQSDPEAFSVNGTTDFKAIDCITYANSTSDSAYRAVGTSTAEATAFYTAGDVSGVDSFSPAPFTHQAPVKDMMAGLRAPKSIDDCPINSKPTTLKKGHHTLKEGTYCGGLTLNAQADVKFEGGTYVIKNGELELSGGSWSYGEGVHFHFVGPNAHLKVRGGANVEFSAKRDGEYGGILFAQHPDAAPGETSDIQGGGRVKFGGLLYFPTQTVEIGGNGDLGLETDAWAIIADKIRVHGNGQVRIKAKFEDNDLPDILPVVEPKPSYLVQ
jgi:Flp pilus assembly protein TadG